MLFFGLQRFSVLMIDCLVSCFSTRVCVLHSCTFRGVWSVSARRNKKESMLGVNSLNICRVSRESYFKQSWRRKFNSFDKMMKFSSAILAKSQVERLLAGQCSMDVFL